MDYKNMDVVELVWEISRACDNLQGPDEIKAQLVAWGTDYARQRQNAVDLEAQKLAVDRLLVLYFSNMGFTVDDPDAPTTMDIQDQGGAFSAMLVARAIVARAKDETDRAALQLHFEASLGRITDLIVTRLLN